jgi:hypothetical protein
MKLPWAWLELCTAAANSLAVLTAFVITIIGGVTCLWLAIFPAQPDTQTIVATSTLSMIVVILLAVFFWREVAAAREMAKVALERATADRIGRYAGSSEKRRMLALSIKELSVKLGRELQRERFNESTLESATAELGHVMDDIASLFSFLTGAVQLRL